MRGPAPFPVSGVAGHEPQHKVGATPRRAARLVWSEVQRRRRKTRLRQG